MPIQDKVDNIINNALGNPKKRVLSEKEKDALYENLDKLLKEINKDPSSKNTPKAPSVGGNYKPLYKNGKRVVYKATQTGRIPSKRDIAKDLDVSEENLNKPKTFPDLTLKELQKLNESSNTCLRCGKPTGEINLEFTIVKGCLPCEKELCS